MRCRRLGPFPTQRLVFAAVLFAFPALAQERTSNHSSRFEQELRPMLTTYCTRCHSTAKPKGDLDLERLVSAHDVRRNPRTWQRVIEVLHEREMPPEGQAQPSVEERERILAWCRDVLGEIARAQAGDPGPVVLRRLSNAEYTYTLRDLTGLERLDPAREFPVDGAAGEGFMNVGSALVMSPELLTKYLDAAKSVAAHMVLLPDGLRFAPGTTRRDWTEECLERIRAFHRRFTSAGGGERVNLQGIVFSTNEGGRLPLEAYLAASRTLRDVDLDDEGVFEVASAHGLSPKYLRILLATMRDREASCVLDPIREAWRADSVTVPELAQRIERIQAASFRWNSVGHIGKAHGPRSWMESVDPLVARQEFELRMPASDSSEALTLRLRATDAGDDVANDVVLWQRPRFVAPGKPDLLLRDVRAVLSERTERRRRLFAKARAALTAAAQVWDARGAIDLDDLARRHDLDVLDLRAWLRVLGMGEASEITRASCFARPLEHASTHAFVQGWGLPETPSVISNASDTFVRVPGDLKPRSVAIHPSPTLGVGVAWKSPLATTLRIEAAIQDAHLACGNGVAWSLELRRGTWRQRLAGGFTQGGNVVRVEPIDTLRVEPGDGVTLFVTARDHEHTCDLTAIDLRLAASEDVAWTWDLAQDCANDVLAANPHADRHGNDAVWYFTSEPDRGDEASLAVVPPGSLLDRWRKASSEAARAQLADELARLLDGVDEHVANAADASMKQALAAFDGPLLASDTVVIPEWTLAEQVDWGLDPDLFGRDVEGGTIHATDLCVTAPSTLSVRLPRDLLVGRTFVVTGTLHPRLGHEGSVQMHVVFDGSRPSPDGLPGAVVERPANRVWTAHDATLTFVNPIVVAEGSAARDRLVRAFDAFRAVFPPTLCYARIVPVDEVVTLRQFYREDAELVRLMLDESEARELDRLWDDLHFVAQDALTQVDAFEQLYQFATQDADPSVFEPLREPIRRAATTFRRRLLEAEPRHLAHVVALAERAYRRPLQPVEERGLHTLYAKLRTAGMTHDEAIRTTCARVLVAPTFLYRAERPGAGVDPQPLDDWELASRLSYFLWSSLPDEELLAVASSGELQQPDVLAAQARRMLRDPRVRRLGREFGCAWLHVYAFDELGEKSERTFPTFASLQGAMYEEVTLFLTSLFQGNGRVLDLLDADYTYLNEALATHYGIPGVTGSTWRRVDGVKGHGRGGILALAAVLAKQSGASRTSPILRGNWLCEVLLGEKLPRPPKNVPRLPEDEGALDLTMRELVERHRADPSCATCHERMDAFGFALERYDAIGRLRTRDLAGRAIDTRVRTYDDATFDGLDGLRNYLGTIRREDFLEQFCRKLLGYALGRAIQLSDTSLLEDMQTCLREDGHMDALVETIVRSRPFREIRGRDHVSEN